MPCRGARGARMVAWVAGGRPRSRASMPGEVFWWLGWPRRDLGGRSSVLPPVGRVKNARKTTAGASGQADKRSKRTNPQLRAACGAASKQARARMLIAARASREPRARERSAATHIRNNSRGVRSCALTCARATWLPR